MITKIAKDKKTYLDLQHSVQASYLEYFNAHIIPMPEFFYCLHHSESNPKGEACIGISRLASQTVMCESYLDKPIEEVLSTDRSKIVELGSLASFGSAGHGVKMLGEALISLKEQNYRYGIMTGTRQIRKMLKRLKVDFDVLANASQDKISGGIDNWGSYYEFDPQVCVVDLQYCDPDTNFLLKREACTYQSTNLTAAISA